MSKLVRCAIYTRKSSEEGLEQDFNSLHAQREACAAYVMSQAGEGWSLMDEAYDDGGISGGTLERPGLKRLLADIAAKRIDIVVVYKVDRLTRSLLDFAKLVEAFDAAGTSFVSVTQSFNTTTSMGRLTLNMLLSFAQFEREVTAERIRDKIAASKARGMWMGGTPPLGYAPDGRTLAIVDTEAALVRDIYQRYLDTGNVRLVVEALERTGIHAPARTRRNGTTFGQCVFSRGQITHILTSPVYNGRIAHKDKLYPGLHPAIIEDDLWHAVQARLSDNVRGTRRARQPNASLLAGKIVDQAGEPLISVHACKAVPSGAEGAKRRYRYYVSRALQTGAPSDAGMRVPAREMEQLVVQQVASLFDDPIEVIVRSWLEVPPERYRAVGAQCALVAARLRAGGEGASLLRQLVMQVRVQPAGVTVELHTVEIATALNADLADDVGDTVILACDATVRRTGRSMKLVHSDGISFATGDPSAALVKLVVQARRWWAMLAEGNVTIGELAVHERVTASWMTRVVRIAFLAPSVVEAVLAGKQPAGLAATDLVASGAVPALWTEQEARYLNPPA